MYMYMFQWSRDLKYTSLLEKCPHFGGKWRRELYYDNSKAAQGKNLAAGSIAAGSVAVAASVTHIASDGCVAFQLLLTCLYVLVEEVNLSLEEMNPGSILVINDRGIPLGVSTAIQRLSIELDLQLLDVGDCLVQLVSGYVQLYQEETALRGQSLGYREEGTPLIRTPQNGTLIGTIRIPQ